MKNCLFNLFQVQGNEGFSINYSLRKVKIIKKFILVMGFIILFDVSLCQRTMEIRNAARAM